MMNAKAWDLRHAADHLSDASMGFPSAATGSPTATSTTPRDFALLCRYLILHTDILKAYTFGQARGNVRRGDAHPAAPDEQP